MNATLFKGGLSEILGNGKKEETSVPPQEVGKEVTPGQPLVDDKKDIKHRRRRTQAEMAAARAAEKVLVKKITCEHDDVPDMPVGAGVVRPGIQIKESYPMVARLLENNAEFVILYKRILTMKSVFCQDQWSKEELKYMNERFKDGGVL